MACITRYLTKIWLVARPEVQGKRLWKASNPHPIPTYPWGVVVDIDRCINCIRDLYRCWHWISTDFHIAAIYYGRLVARNLIHSVHIHVPVYQNSNFLATCTCNVCHSVAEFSSVVNKVLPSSLGHYSVLLVSRDLLPRGSGLSDDSGAVYVSQYRHAIIGTDSGTV